MAGAHRGGVTRQSPRPGAMSTARCCSSGRENTRRGGERGLPPPKAVFEQACAAAIPTFAAAASRIEVLEAGVQGATIKALELFKRNTALEATLSYLRTQAKNGTLHPQVVIQNVTAALN